VLRYIDKIYRTMIHDKMNLLRI